MDLHNEWLKYIGEYYVKVLYPIMFVFI